MLGSAEGLVDGPNDGVRCVGSSLGASDGSVEGIALTAGGCDGSLLEMSVDGASDGN